MEVVIPEGLEAKVEGNVLTVTGTDKQAVGAVHGRGAQIEAG